MSSWRTKWVWISSVHPQWMSHEWTMGVQSRVTKPYVLDGERVLSASIQEGKPESAGWQRKAFNHRPLPQSLFLTFQNPISKNDAKMSPLPTLGSSGNQTDLSPGSAQAWPLAFSRAILPSRGRGTGPGSQAPTDPPKQPWPQGKPAGNRIQKETRTIKISNYLFKYLQNIILSQQSNATLCSHH